MKSLIINRPDDWHVHFRDGDVLEHTVAATAGHFKRALVMPNLKPALTKIDAIMEYRERILAVIPQGNPFTPYMTFYLNESVIATELEHAASIPFILGAKFYPAGATTHSEAGAKCIEKLFPLLEVMQDNDLVLQIHGEVTHSDIFERESLFIEEYLQRLVTNFPKLRMVLEHISTKAAVDFVTNAPATIAATITPHHLMYNRNKLLAGGIRPHYYCLPILKQASDQKALQWAATSGNPKFFAGTDSAPHDIANKESACGCAGIYSAPFALAFYAQLFDDVGCLDKLDGFTSKFGAYFYQLESNTEEIQITKAPQPIPASLPLGHSQVIPMAAGELVQWSINDVT